MQERIYDGNVRSNGFHHYRNVSLACAITYWYGYARSVQVYNVRTTVRKESLRFGKVTAHLILTPLQYTSYIQATTWQHDIQTDGDLKEDELTDPSIVAAV